MTSQWLSPGTPVSSTNQTDGHDITDILLKVALNTLTVAVYISFFFVFVFLHHNIVYSKSPVNNNLNGPGADFKGP